jgi:uncharacterized protein YndB with AHSA1/START domain
MMHAGRPVVLLSALLLLACSTPGARKGGTLESNPAQISKQILVPASPEQVWEAWTTVDGVKSFFAPDGRIDLNPGGAYEMYFDPKAEPGQRGSEGCTLLAVDPNAKRLVFNWNFPPSLPSIRKQKTVVEVTLIEEGGKTRVRLMQRGFKTSDDWQKGRAYFDKAWDKVLSRLAQRFETGQPVDLSR